MTELKRFLVAMYDALSQAEVEALAHGQKRLAELVEEGTVPAEAASVPVYHAADVDVTLDVGLRAEETDNGTDIYITETDPEQGSALTFSVQLFELLERDDLEDVDYEDILTDRPASGRRGESLRQPGREPAADEEEAADREGTADEGGPPEERATDEGATGGDRVTGGRLFEILDELGRSAGREGEETEEVDRAPESEPVEAIDGIGPRYGERLRDRGIGTVEELAAESADTVAGLASTADQSVSAERAADWIEQATRRRERRDQEEAD